MVRLLEIGGGIHPGPRFDDVDEHLSIDLDPDAVDQATRFHPEIDSLVGDAEVLADFEDSSVDIVLARNVLGDPLLGFIDRDTRIRAGEDLTRKGSLGEAYRIVKGNKLRILASVARVLTDGGRLIIVEQMTPEITEDFLRAHEQEITTGLQIERTELDSVAPENYVYAHNRISQAVVWIGRNSKEAYDFKDLPTSATNSTSRLL